MNFDLFKKFNPNSRSTKGSNFTSLCCKVFFAFEAPSVISCSNPIALKFYNYVASCLAYPTRRVMCTTILVINLESNISLILKTCALFLKLLIVGLQRICEARNVISSHSIHHVFQLCNSNYV